MNYRLVIRGPAHNWLHVKETPLTLQEMKEVYLPSNLYGNHSDITLAQLLNAAKDLVKNNELDWCRSWIESPSQQEEEDQKIAIKKVLHNVGLTSINDEQYEEFLEGFSYYFPNCYRVESIEYISYNHVPF